ncbi:MAG: hypothetical protein NTV34_03760, partial [Proteobacteria bacterium]|nr:hypothetical protein [Pseudomonadota bacterium]
MSPSKGGLAIYHNEDFTGVVRIATKVSDLVVAAQSFHLKPILRSLPYHQSYYLLALRERCADLFLVKPDGHTKLKRFDVCRSVQGATSDSDKKPTSRALKHRTNLDFQKKNAGNMIRLNQELKTYFDNNQFPLMISGPSHLQEGFRNNCAYVHTMEPSLEGDINYLDEKALVGLSGHVFEQYLLEKDSMAVDNFIEAGKLGLASANLADIAVAAARGQVSRLLIAEDTHIWGHLDRTSGAFEVLTDKDDATSDDLLDDLAELTLQKGGGVTVLPISQMPNGAPIAAILRWSDPGNCDQAFIPLRSKSHFSPLVGGG